MKILVIGVFDLETDESHIAQTLEQMGHDVVRWRPQRGGGHRKRFGGAAGAIVGLSQSTVSRRLRERSQAARETSSGREAVSDG